MKGDTRVFVVINTTDYDNDTAWSVVTANVYDLAGLGFDNADQERIDGLNVGGILTDFDFDGVIVIRIA